MLSICQQHDTICDRKSNDLLLMNACLIIKSRLALDPLFPGHILVDLQRCKQNIDLCRADTTHDF